MCVVFFMPSNVHSLLEMLESLPRWDSNPGRLQGPPMAPLICLKVTLASNGNQAVASILDTCEILALIWHISQACIKGSILICSCGCRQVLVTCREADGEVSSSSPVCVMFDKEEVPATRLQRGVYRCHAPPHEASTVNLSITWGNGAPCSNTQPFTYRVTPQTARTQVHTPCLQTPAPLDYGSAYAQNAKTCCSLAPATVGLFPLWHDVK